MKIALTVFAIVLVVSNVLVWRGLFVLLKAFHDLDGNYFRLRKDLEKHTDYIFELSRKVNRRGLKLSYKLHTDIPTPKQTDKGDWIDLYASEDVELKAGEYKVIPLGISMELPQGYGAIVAPRSSTYKNFGIRMTNSIGIIDNSYCGDNDVWGFCAVADRDTTIHKGDKIAQFMIYPIMPKVVFDRVETLGNEDRGGYGTTGRR